MNKIMISCAMVVLLLVLVAASYRVSTIYVDPQKTITLVCKGDEFLTTVVNKREIILTCRVWVR